MNKKRVDRWFVIILGIMLYTLASQLWGMGTMIAYNLGNFTFWMKIVGCLIAIYGNIWVIRIYLSSIIKQNRRMALLDEKLKGNPELQGIVRDILRG